MREKKYFLAGENKFIYGKKFTGMREKIPALAEAGKTRDGGWDLSETQPTNRKVETEKKLRRGAELSISITKH